MDHFGIGNAMIGVMETYFRSARRSGRSESLLESVKSGDRIVFLTTKEANTFKRLCQQRSLEISVVTIPVNRITAIFDCGERPKGRTLFDHSWLEEFYRQGVHHMVDHIDRVQKESSGRDAPAHRETQRAKKEASRWR